MGVIDKQVMKVVIIAAGLGSRIRKHGDSKPLVLVQGISLLERVIMNAKKVGIKEFFIVVGFNGNKIKQAIGNGEKYNIKIKYIQNNEWDKGNGLSALKAKSYISDHFVLMMSDHIFDHTILEDLIKVKLANDECVLCVDRTPSNHTNIEDATKVYLEETKIIKIGKSLKNYNAVDTGIFLCNSSLFYSLEKSILIGNDSLSGAIQLIADNGNMRFYDIGDRFWIDVDDSEDYKNAQILSNKFS